MRTNAIILTCGLLLAAYFASYFVLVCRPQMGFNGSFREGQRFAIPAFYRYGGRWADLVYSPAHRVDRRLRPGYWTVTIHYREFNVLTDFR